MKEYLVVINPDDTIEALPFDGLSSLQKAVEGNIALVGTKSIMVAPDVFADDNILIVLYGDRDYSRKHYGKGDVKVNALASSLVGKPVYGKVAFVRDIKNEDEHGFSDDTSNNAMSEISYIRSILNGLIEKTKDYLQRLHEIWDNKMPEPQLPFRPLQKRSGKRFIKK